MIPSNLVLQVGVIQKYNNNVVIADDSTEIGENAKLRAEKNSSTDFIMNNICLKFETVKNGNSL